MNAALPPAAAARLQRQKRTLLALGAVLIAGGLAVLFLLPRLPTPLRVLVGLTDLVGGTVVLLLVRQKFRPPTEPPSSETRKDSGA